VIAPLVFRSPAWRLLQGVASLACLSTVLALHACGVGARTVVSGTGPVSLPLVSAATHDLSQKASWFEDKIRRQHLTPEGLLAYEIDSTREEVHPTAFADMAIWSGGYLAAEAFRFQATGERDAAQRVFLVASGINRLVEVTGKPGLLARALKRNDISGLMEPKWHASSVDSNLIWYADVSADQVDGVLFGAGVAYDALENVSERRLVANWASAIVGHIVDHKMTIEDIGGARTRHGDFTCGWRSEPLNCLVALSAVKVAHHVTGEERFARAYESLVARGYARRAVSARRPWWERWTGVNHSDNNLAFLAYYNLIRYEQDPVLLDLYRQSLRRAWSVVRREKNPFFTFVFHALVPQSEWDRTALYEAVDTLRRFPTERRSLAPNARPDQCIAAARDRFGRKQACEPVPIDERPQASMEWNGNPYRLEGGQDDRMAYSGFDYLLAYWLGRSQGFIGPDA